MLSFGIPLVHWNYYLALEQDLKKISRYIEFCTENEKTYSIELAHILLSASSEIDVVMKLLCKKIKESCKTKNIEDYRKVIKSNLPNFISEEISIPRYNMISKPWQNWTHDKNPEWWKAYNDVKHKRNEYFQEANLKNVINSLGALFLTVIYYYYFDLKERADNISIETTMVHLKPRAEFFQTKYRLIDWIYFSD